MSVMLLTVASALSKLIRAGSWNQAAPLAAQLRKPRNNRIMCAFSRAFFPFDSGVYSMANIASARKRARQSEKRRQHNAALRSELRSAVRNARKAIAAGDKQAAMTVFRRAASTIDSIADKNIIHKNTAARHKSRLAARLKAMA
jgi:small subunit ribosomal protein S20